MEYDEDLHFRTTGDQRRIRSRTRFACGRSPGSGDQGRMGGVTCRRRPAGNHDNDRALFLLLVQKKVATGMVVLGLGHWCWCVFPAKEKGLQAKLMLQ
ncbi:hypothetical protein VIGAN_11196800 [Vigna angularis var. angularis]|uniref:Uncharacterized protein n=1 Tax=Vigna angularis var. angularis TaxID=157739 RepID=A0A0S3TBK6_PHAAN|nr:hypothetical protein VIGAN_11196800 [Vigna angularis var. angularis]